MVASDAGAGVATTAAPVDGRRSVRGRNGNAESDAVRHLFSEATLRSGSDPWLDPRSRPPIPNN